MNIQKNIAATLRSAMKEKDMTLVEFAEEVGIAKSTLQGYLKEHSNPRADTIELLSQRLNIPLTQLIEDPEEVKGCVELPQAAEIHPSLIPVLELCRGLSTEVARLSAMLAELEREDKRI